MAGAVAPAAYAADPQSVEVMVRYGDLDLSDAHDARTLVGRIDRAARRACGGEAFLNSTRGIERTREQAAFDACRQEAVRDALAQLDAPQVLLAYQRFGETRT
jgi:UrcA family protein